MKNLTSKISHTYKEFRRGDFVVVINNDNIPENGLWAGHTGTNHRVRFVDAGIMDVEDFRIIRSGVN